MPAADVTGDPAHYHASHIACLWGRRAASAEPSHADIAAQPPAAAKYAVAQDAANTMTARDFVTLARVSQVCPQPALRTRPSPHPTHRTRIPASPSLTRGLSFILPSSETHLAGTSNRPGNPPTSRRAESGQGGHTRFAPDPIRPYPRRRHGEPCFRPPVGAGCADSHSTGAFHGGRQGEGRGSQRQRHARTAQALDVATDCALSRTKCGKMARAAASKRID